MTSVIVFCGFTPSFPPPPPPSTLPPPSLPPPSSPSLPPPTPLISSIFLVYLWFEELSLSSGIQGACTSVSLAKNKFAIEFTYCSSMCRIRDDEEQVCCSFYIPVQWSSRHARLLRWLRKKRFLTQNVRTSVSVVKLPLLSRCLRKDFSGGNVCNQCSKL